MLPDVGSGICSPAVLPPILHELWSKTYSWPCYTPQLRPEFEACSTAEALHGAHSQGDSPVQFMSYKLPSRLCTMPYQTELNCLSTTLITKLQERRGLKPFCSTSVYAIAD